jgi:hypothetical protein
MALINQAPAQNNNNNRIPAEGFLNIQVKDANGDMHAISCTIPLYSNQGNNANRSLLKAGAIQDKTFELVGTVHLVNSEVEEVIF